MSSPLQIDGALSARFAPSGDSGGGAAADLVAVGDGTVSLWNTKTGERLPQRPENETGSSILWAAFDPDRSYVLTVTEHPEERRGVGPTYELGARDPQTLELVSSVDLLDSERIGRVFLSDDGARLVTLSGGVSPAKGGAASVAPPALWALRTAEAGGGAGGDTGGGAEAELIRRLEGHAQGVWFVDLSADGGRVVTAGEEGTARLWTDRPEDAPETLEAHLGPVYTARFSADGRRVVTASADRTAMVWNVDEPSATPLILRHHGRVFSAAFSPDGQRVGTVSEDGTARLWMASTGEAIGEPMEHEGPVVAVRFSADGTRLLTSSLSRVWTPLALRGAQPLRETAHLWNGETGEPLGVALGHSGTVSMVDLSPDGSGLVTVSSDGVSRVWNLSVASPEEFERLAMLAEAVAGFRVNDRGGTESLGDRDHASAIEDLDQDVGGLVLELTRWFAQGPNAPSIPEPSQAANQRD